MNTTPDALESAYQAAKQAGIRLIDASLEHADQVAKRCIEKSDDSREGRCNRADGLTTQDLQRGEGCEGGDLVRGDRATLDDATAHFDRLRLAGGGAKRLGHRGRVAVALEERNRGRAFKEGEQVQIREGPMQADGYTWWRIESRAGIGWSAERSKEGVVWLQPTD